MRYNSYGGKTAREIEFKHHCSRAMGKFKGRNLWVVTRQNQPNLEGKCLTWINLKIVVPNQ